ncbi:hypothetical protein K492DRAFT_210821 [Lichtheimia hyalospora FSU 10163]|nr:hypothetical protein K492DRAFT_210821 [Lichtheimia hyalospora FSU 10163]
MQPPPVTNNTTRRESYTEALNTAIHRYNALLSTQTHNNKWTKIKSQPIPRSARIHMYRRNDISETETVYKVVLECLTQSDRPWTLSGWHSLFSNPDTRKLWDHMVDRVQVVENEDEENRWSPNVLVTRRIPNDKSEASNVMDTGQDHLFVEKTSRKKNRLLYISASTTQQHFMAYDIRMSPDDDPALDSRVTLIYQSSTTTRQDILESYIISLITGPLSVLGLHGAPPFIIRRHPYNGIHGVNTAYYPDRHEWNLQYQVDTTQKQSSSSCSSSKVESIHIKQAVRQQSHHQSASWDHQSSLQLASSLRHRKNSFMASSLLITPSYATGSLRPSQSPKLIPKSQDHTLRSDVFSSSYTFGSHMHEGMAENRAAATTAPDVMLELDHQTWATSGCIDMDVHVSLNQQSLDTKMTDQFAQFCIRCYRQRQRQNGAGYRYFVTLHHPTQFIRSMRHDGDGEKCIEVQVKLKPVSTTSADKGFHQVYVNGKEWPFRLWEGRAWSSNHGDKVDDGGSDSELLDDTSSDDSSEDEDQVTSSGESGDSGGDHEHGVFAGDMEGFIPNRDSTSGSDQESQDIKQDSAIPPLSLEPTVTSEPITESPIEHEETEEEPALVSSVIDVPNSEPTQLVKMHTYFDSLLQRTGWNMLQSPEAANLFVGISKLDVSGHPVGAYLSESIWRDCSIWDVKAVINCIGARKIWDSTFEDASFVHQVSPTCSIWHYKTKGFWTVSPRDYVAFSAAYMSPGRIDFCATSCISDTFGHVTLPKDQPGHVRARLDLWAWRLERYDNNTTTVKLINQANPQGWIPSYIPNSLSGHHPDIVMHAHQYFNKYGAPPDLVMLQHGSLVNIAFDQQRKSLRAEYIRSAEPVSASSSSIFGTTHSNGNGSTKVEIRLDGRRQDERQRSYNVVIDPPPSRVHASTRNYDPYGWWLEIEHDEEHIIPQRGKILLLIKPEIHDDRLVVNGVPADICKGASPTSLIKSLPPPHPVQDKPHQLETTSTTTSGSMTLSAAAASTTTGTNATMASTAAEQEKPKQPSTTEDTTTPITADSIESIVKTLPVTPKEYAQRAMSFMAKMVDQQFGWNNVSDKSGLQISKRQGTSKTIDQIPMVVDEPFAIPEPSLIVKASKVIEGFSVEEVVSVVTDTGPLRRQYDESIEEIEPLMQLAHGCSLVRQVIKGGFLFKSREIYVAACTAHEKVNSTTNPAAKRVIYIEASIPNFPVPKSSKRQQALFCISGWILEAIDPYTTTTNHPIPSTRATFVASLDLGASVPAYFSNQLALGLPKKIKALEHYLKSNGPPPYLTKPLDIQGFGSEQLTDQVIKELYADHGAVEWNTINKNYDQKTCEFKMQCAFRLAKKMTAPARSNLSVSLQRSKQLATSPTSTAANKRRKSVTIADTGSVSSSNSSGQSVVEQDLVLVHAIVDLRNYAKGYEITAKMTRHDGLEEEKDVSRSLYARVSELAPEPSHLVANTSKIPQKHAIELYLPASSPMSRFTSRECITEMSLGPVQQESLNKRGTRLTVSGVLGEEDNQWRGLILLNGREIEATGTSECVATATTISNSPETENRSDDETLPEEQVADQQSTSSSSSSPPTASMGGGVVAAALGGVSAGVNDIRARMLLPFRSASTHFMSTDGNDDDNNNDGDRFSSPMSVSSFSDQEELCTPPLYAENQVQLRQRRMRSQSDLATSRRKRSSTASNILFQPSSLSSRLAGFLVMFLFFILLLGILLPSIAPIDTSQMHIRYLWSMPWFGGWRIQVIAVQR